MMNDPGDDWLFVELLNGSPAALQRDEKRGAASLQPELTPLTLMKLSSFRSVDQGAR
jgi:hypothetical protein